MKDTARLMLAEFNGIVANNSYGNIEAIKSTWKSSLFSKKNIKNNLKSKKKAFDYTIIRMLSSHGYRDTNIGDKFDEIFEEIWIENEVRVEIIFNIVPTVLQPIPRGVMKNMSVIKEIWDSYIVSCEKIFKTIIDVK